MSVRALAAAFLSAIGPWAVTSCGGGPGAAPPSPVAQAGGDAATRRRACADVDTTLAGGVPAYRDCEVDRQAAPRGRIPLPAWEPAAGNRRECYRAVIGLVVDEQGVPVVPTIHVVRTDDINFGRAVADAVSSWRFTPALKGGVAVRQWVRIEQTAMVRVVVTRAPAGAALPRTPPPAGGGAGRC